MICACVVRPRVKNGASTYGNGVDSVKEETRAGSAAAAAAARHEETEKEMEKRSSVGCWHDVVVTGGAATLFCAKLVRGRQRRTVRVHINIILNHLLRAALAITWQRRGGRGGYDSSAARVGDPPEQVHTHART